jgi:hypothetical protein
MKTTGLELKRFYNDEAFWPEGAWIDEWHIEVGGTEVDPDDIETIPDEAKASFQGIVFLEAHSNNWITLDTFFHRWKKQQTHTIALVELPKDQLEDLKQLAKAHKWRIL